YRPTSLDRLTPRRTRGGAMREWQGPIRIPARSGQARQGVTAMATGQNDAIKEALSRLPKLDIRELREEWRRLYKADTPPRLISELLIRAVAHRMQEVALGALRPELQRQLHQIALELKQTGAATT